MAMAALSCRLHSGMANRIHPMVSAMEMMEAILFKIITIPMRREAISLITISSEGCHLRRCHLIGSGKSYLAKALRDLEVESGGSAPRIHSMDDYFMIEVEKKVEDNEGSKSSTASKGRKQLTKKVIEYCYEPEMEETYRSSMLNAFKKTLDEGNFTFVIVDDRNLRIADFAQFWASAKRSGYEVYLLEAPYKDPTTATNSIFVE
uniref:YLP motif-containing protein 1 n=1 Tax=Aegilops tauschii TaxID=37682 RepID=M8CC97_AEGTA